MYLYKVVNTHYALMLINCDVLLYNSIVVLKRMEILSLLWKKMADRAKLVCRLSPARDVTIVESEQPTFAQYTKSHMITMTRSHIYSMPAPL